MLSVKLASTKTARPWCCRLLAFSVVGTVGAASLPAAIIDPPIRFGSSADYTDNFRKLDSNGMVTVSGGFLRVGGLGAGTATSLLLDQNLGLTGAQPNDFLTETLSLDFAFTAYGSALGFYVRERTPDGPAVLALASFPAVNTLRLRLLHGADPTTGALGASFADQTFTTSFNAGGDYRLRLEQTAATDPGFTLSVLVGTTVRASLDGTLGSSLTNLYDGPGAVGLRFEGSAGNPTFFIDNFGAVAPPVPEPTTMGLLATGLLAGLSLFWSQRNYGTAGALLGRHGHTSTDKRFTR